MWVATWLSAWVSPPPGPHCFPTAVSGVGVWGGERLRDWWGLVMGCGLWPVVRLDPQSCPTPCDPMGCSPPGPSVQEIFQARILEWIAISYSRGSPWPRDWTRILYISCIDRRVFFFFFFLPLSHLGIITQQQKGGESLMIYFQSMTDKDLLYSTGNYA